MSKLSSVLVVGGLILGLCLSVGAQETPKVGTAKTGTVKIAPPTPTVPGSGGFKVIEEPTKIINDMLSKAWKDNNLTPAPRCDDYEFARRVTLDIIGRIPSVEEIDQYLKDPVDNRRALLVDRLLVSPDYAKNWSHLWTHWLMTRAGGNQIYRAQMQLWLEDEMFGKPTMSYKEMVTSLITATGKTNENGAVNFILTHLGEAQRDKRKDGDFDMLPVTARVVRSFLGYQIQCTQCHDHPFNADWKQKHFWGVNAFLRQVQRVGNPQQQQQNNNMQNQAPVLTLTDNPTYNEPELVFYEKRNGVFLPSYPIFLDGNRFPKGTKVSRREELARFVTSYKVKDEEGKGYEQFSRAFINRMWGHFFGRGLNIKQQFDDFGEHNEVVHEALLNKLAEQLAGTGAYDPRKVIRWLTASDAYNLKAVANKSNDSPEAEPYFSRIPIKMMSPEQLLESLIVATRPAAGEQRQFRDTWLNLLVRNFGDDEGTEATYNGTILQALLMMNGGQLNGAINQQSGTVDKAAKMNNGRQTLNYLFLSTLSRPATDKEYNQLVRQLPLAGGRLKDNDGQGPLKDVFWALLNCNEFILNH